MFQFSILNSQFSIPLPLLAVCFALLLTAPSPVCAHDPGLSALTLRLTNSTLAATLTLARADAEALVVLDANRDGRLTTEEFDKARPELELAGADALEIRLDGTNVEPASVAARIGPGDEVSLELSFPLAAGKSLAVRSALLPQLPRGHRQYAVLLDGRGNLLAEKLLDARQAVLEARLPDAEASPIPAPSSFGQFLWLGVEHIITGWDHLVFLLGLLIVGGAFRAVVKIITAFTVAHSITLALATLDVIRLPPSVVEPLIAASIIYVGVENIVRRELEWRWALAFAFGLIHGCGFASVLRELGVGANSAGVVLPLLSFNLGVELGQVALAALVLPLIWKLKTAESFRTRWVPACSVLIALAGAYWLAERVLPMVRR